MAKAYFKYKIVRPIQTGTQFFYVHEKIRGWAQSLIRGKIIIENNF